MAQPRRSKAPRRTPFWLACLCGFLWADTTLSLTGREREARAVAARAVGPGVSTGPEVLEDGDPRDLRGLPGIGERRALDIARWRWERSGGELRLSEVPGVGPKTERLLRAREALPQPLLGE
ncbi:MAG: helix-hairpin-helix domain-containing protein [Planctomycetota bacterium]|nr:helix-hairpin-helix domain-containing protein [Planctomycetota bacterium]MDP6762846.1 helix-hairpin-helix domain-containing protein [Planctomycetota bacterium]MDP6990433.1 helix-hairpin-helix domain-containing protein [Planctomycetota bacterium]